MKPVTVSATVSKSSRDVYEFLEVLANHELFMDRMFIDWRFSGPERGGGAQARAEASAPPSQDLAGFEDIEAGPRRVVEEAGDAGGKRRTPSTYQLQELPHGRKRIS